MKTKYAMVLVGALMTGCLPQTLFPLYSEETLAFEPLLLGIWHEGDDERWIFSAADPQSFHLQIRDDEALTGEFDVHVVDLDGVLFLDLYAEEPPDDWSDVYELHFIPVHTFIRIDVTLEALTMSVMNLDWLRDHLEENPSALEHKMLGKHQVLVTAQTPQIQAFVLEHLDTEGAFEDLEVLERGPTSGSGSATIRMLDRAWGSAEALGAALRRLGRQLTRRARGGSGALGATG